MNTNQLFIESQEYRLDMIKGLAVQSPTIAVGLNEIHVLGTEITDNRLNQDSIEVKRNPGFNEGQIVVFSYFGKYVLLQGYDKYLLAKDSGKTMVKCRLMSKPVLKRAKVIELVTPTPVTTPRFSNHGHDAHQDQAAIRPSRPRKSVNPRHSKEVIRNGRT